MSESGKTALIAIISSVIVASMTTYFQYIFIEKERVEVDRLNKQIKSLEVEIGATTKFANNLIQLINEIYPILSMKIRSKKYTKNNIEIELDIGNEGKSVVDVNDVYFTIDYKEISTEIFSLEDPDEYPTSYDFSKIKGEYHYTPGTMAPNEVVPIQFSLVLEDPTAPPELYFYFRYCGHIHNSIRKFLGEYVEHSITPDELDSLTSTCVNMTDSISRKSSVQSK